MIERFNEGNHAAICDRLAEKDSDLRSILQAYGYPPVWTRTPDFPSLIHIILEQQVSLASAKAAFNKLSEKLGAISPQALLELSDEELRACYFSRQKASYARHLATMLVDKKLVLENFIDAHDDVVRKELKTVKGIGDWTVDIYLLFALQRCDIFPTGDLAMINAFKELKGLPKETTKEQIVEMAEQWRPYRSIATYMLWHFYIKSRNIRI
ncbi:MAG: DNA-3-methyladenine glycosylase 2 family protein [Chitinophagaceae bacterium]|nr:DNA-3-methyladenine glycosylase 2 family protein [Chitinophagaceae bacterium]